MLVGMGERIQAETGIDVVTLRNPLEAVVLGARAMLPIVAILDVWKR